MKPGWGAAAIIATVVVVGTSVAAHRRNMETRAWEARVQQAEQAAREARTRADSAIVVADSLQTQAQLLFSRAGERIQTVRARVEEVRAVVVPDTCISLVASRDTLIDDALAAAETAQQAYGAERVVAQTLRGSYEGMRVSNDSLLAVLAARPRPRTWWKPTLGVTAGLGVRGLDAVVGLTWEIRL
jgi:hypothetical protein